MWSKYLLDATDGNCVFHASGLAFTVKLVVNLPSAEHDTLHICRVVCGGASLGDQSLEMSA